MLRPAMSGAMIGAISLIALAAQVSRAALPGLVVPKRSSLISGLNQQFRPRNHSLAAAWLAAGRGPSRQRPPPAPSGGGNSVRLERRHQELLAAHPDLDASRAEAGGLAAAWPNQPANQAAEEAPGRQLYRGHSLIELELRSEPERRFLHQLQANLSAALDEQALRPRGPLTVSPYVDVDFWSLNSALNDEIDIMVSPKARPFILAQLSRAKIRHKIKIDDIQARLDAQLAPPAGPPATSGLNQGPLQLSARADLQPAPEQQPAAGSGAADQPAGRQLSPAPLNESAFFENYQRLAEINQFLEALVERSPDVAQVKVIGRSSQGRYLRVLKLGYQQPAADEAGQEPPRGAPPAEHLAPSGERDVHSGQNNATYILEAFFRRQAASPGRKLGSIWLDGGTHAREWISPATVLYIAHRLADNHASCRRFLDGLRGLAAGQALDGRRWGPAPADDESLEPELLQGLNEINTSLLAGQQEPAAPKRARSQLERTLEQLAKAPQQLAQGHGCDLQLDQLLRRYTFYIQPVLNPDGYEYSHTHNRLWRKTRSTSPHPIYRHFCLGADPNRNYDVRHGASGSSSHPCSQTYAGSTPFTEPETRHQSNFVYAHRHDMKMFISFHSYSQMILLPFSHSKQLAPDHKDLESVGQAAAKAIERTHGTVYRVGPSASILYTASGTASDWAYDRAGVKYSYTIELRDTGSHGFLLPKQQIVPTGEETFNGLLAMIAQMELNDDLLTSKSHLQPPARNATQSWPQPGGLAQPEPPVNLENGLHAPGPAWDPQLEQAPSGARDRRPGPQADPEGPFESAHRLADEPLANQAEPDAGYAFEGEGDLMEPTHQLQDTQRRLAHSRQLHSRKIFQAAALTSAGRSSINSPPGPDRLHKQLARRETSENLAPK